MSTSQSSRMEFEADDLRPFSSRAAEMDDASVEVDTPETMVRPLTAMSQDERQFADAVRPMTGAAAAAAAAGENMRPPTGIRPPSEMIGGEGGGNRPKTGYRKSQSRIGTAKVSMNLHLSSL